MKLRVPARPTWSAVADPGQLPSVLPSGTTVRPPSRCRGGRHAQRAADELGPRLRSCS
ncbi:hypothetical protein HBB16_15220 [Pseudonocardia sp. MCCB 268]|nr:hypothetical protein [Pseudonocardia cytotoxica]